MARVTGKNRDKFLEWIGLGLAAAGIKEFILITKTGKGRPEWQPWAKLDNAASARSLASYMRTTANLLLAANPEVSVPLPKKLKRQAKAMAKKYKGPIRATVSGKGRTKVVHNRPIDADLPENWGQLRAIEGEPE